MKPHSGNRYLVLGIMSGTSLDGLDLAAIEFKHRAERWEFSVVAAETFAYSVEWKRKLEGAPYLEGEELIGLHNAYGRFIGMEAKRFLEKHRLSPALIASHGHTVFHQPQKGITFHAGNGSCIAAETGITTVADFRTGDVALGGQGAPLVPVGDKLLFPEYAYCLNLGGFANISYDHNRKRIAFDICPVNFVLNHLAQKLGNPFDDRGKLGQTGAVNEALLFRLNHLEFYSQSPPKSLGREWMNAHFFPALHADEISVHDKLRTVYEHIAIQTARSIPNPGKILVTGGGAFNTFLIERMRDHMMGELCIPPDELVMFKEAIIFAFLGLLRFRKEINCLASVTGARKDSCTGIVYR
jgi:anhydro-N-acetylmuramic acid kinase